MPPQRCLADAFAGAFERSAKLARPSANVVLEGIMRLWIALVVAPAALLGCNSRPELADAGRAASDALAPDQAGRVLAKVGDRTITLGDYAAALEHMDPFDRLRYESAERRKALLGEMIDVMLLADEARERGYDKDPVTQQEIREILRDAVLKQARAALPRPSEIPEDEVRAYYEAHRADFRDPERRRVSAVVLTSETAAASVIEALNKNPAAWGDLVRTRSVDPQSKADVPPELAGDLGFVSPPGDPRGTSPRIPAEVRVTVFELENVGDVALRPVRAEGKVYVVKLAGKTAPQDRTLQDAERSVRVKLAQDRINARQAELLAELRKQYPVQIDDAALAAVKVEMGDGGRD
jgi:peptidyl-prolyl cis-trans isomerase C